MFNPFQLNSIWLRPNLQHKSNNFTNRNSWLFIEWSSDNNWKLNLVYNSLFVIFGNPRNWKTVLWPIICQTFITISAVVNVTFFSKVNIKSCQTKLPMCHLDHKNVHIATTYSCNALLLVGFFIRSGNLIYMFFLWNIKFRFNLYNFLPTKHTFVSTQHTQWSFFCK